MRLFLVQHGEAVEKDMNPERPLSEQGRHDLERLAAFLARQEIHANHLWHSGKLRTRQSAQQLDWAVGAEGHAAARDGLAPGDPVVSLASEAGGWEGDTVLVGHQPFLGRLVSYLTQGREEVEIVAFRPGTAVCLERDVEGVWRIVWMVGPDVLAE